MPYSIPSSTKILIYFGNSTIFVLIGALSVCEFAMVRGVYILLYPQKEKLHSSSYTFCCTIIKKI